MLKVMGHFNQGMLPHLASPVWVEEVTEVGKKPASRVERRGRQPFQSEKAKGDQLKQQPIIVSCGTKDVDMFWESWEVGDGGEKQKLEIGKAEMVSAKRKDGREAET